MNTEQKQSGPSSRTRSLSRQMLGNDLDLVNKYASKYSGGTRLHRTQTYSAVPNAYNIYSHGYGSGSNSSSGSLGNNNNYKDRKPRRQPSNLINSSTMSQWDNNTINNQELDMSAAMSSMVNSYQSRINQQAEFLDEMQYEAENNKDFGKVENAEEWSVKEVCYWLTTIHLDKYIKSFHDQIIDGSILLRDLDDSMLINELGIKRLHVKKILREINKLKTKAPKLKKENNDTRDQLIESLRTEIDELKQKNKSLITEIQAIRIKTGYHQPSTSGSNLYSNYKGK